MSTGHIPPGNPLPEPQRVEIIGGTIGTRATIATPLAGDVAGLWITIKNRSAAMEFPKYDDFITRVLCHNEGIPSDDDGEASPGDCASQNPRRVNKTLRQRKRMLLA